MNKMDGPGAGVQVLIDGARRLAEWTRISEEAALALYHALAMNRRDLIDRKTALLGMADYTDIEDLRTRTILCLCRAADKAGALQVYCAMIAGHERESGREQAEVVDIIQNVGHPGYPQGVVDRARGVDDPILFGVLDRITQAIGYVEVQVGVRRDVVGTAFLVQPDVVITCAHVACELELENGAVVAGPLRNISRICFPRTRMGQQEAKLHPANPLLAVSHPHMIGINKLNRDATPPADTRLDFALLRLDRKIESVDKIDIRGNPVAAHGGLSWVIGFPGIRDARFDADHIVRDERQGARLIHMMNTLNGMSGGCVIGQDGIPVGLHEGSIPRCSPETGEPLKNAKGEDDLENRAVLLDVIYADLETRDPNPLMPGKRSRGIIMYDDALVTRLGRRGAQLLGDASFQGRWQQIFDAYTKPRDDVPWTAHPWLADKKRQKLEKWFGEAAEPKATDRRGAFIYGPRGCGKTFMIDVLRRIVDDPDSDVVRVSWTEGETTLETLANRFSSKACAPSGTRTSDGHRRYESIPDLVTALAFSGGFDRNTSQRPLFLAIDAGDGTGSATEPDSWIDLVVALSREPWARVVLCGLPKILKQRLEAALSLDVDFVDFELDHISGEHIVEFLKSAGSADGAVQKDWSKAESDFNALGMPHLTRPELTTTMAALFAIGWHRGFLPEIPMTQGVGHD